LGVCIAGLATATNVLAAPVPYDQRICKPLKAFVASVGPHQKHDVVFNGIWGQGFKDSHERSLMEKLCKHDGYEPAQPLCQALVELGSAEFPDGNAYEVLACLAGVRYGVHVTLANIEASFDFGKGDTYQQVTVRLADDPVKGGKALTISVEGY
jgi:hypothetical protein